MHPAWLLLFIASLCPYESDAEPCEYKYPVENDRIVYHRAIRVKRNETALLPCWELVDPNHLIFWSVSEHLFIRPGDDSFDGKYSVDSNGSLIVQVSVPPIKKY